MNGIDQAINGNPPAADPIAVAIDEMFDEAGGAGAVCFGYLTPRLRHALSLRYAGIDGESFVTAMEKYDEKQRIIGNLNKSLRDLGPGIDGEKIYAALENYENNQRIANFVKGKNNE